MTYSCLCSVFYSLTKYDQVVISQRVIAVTLRTIIIYLG